MQQKEREGSKCNGVNSEQLNMEPRQSTNSDSESRSCSCFDWLLLARRHVAKWLGPYNMMWCGPGGPHLCRHQPRVVWVDIRDYEITWRSHGWHCHNYGMRLRLGSTYRGISIMNSKPNPRLPLSLRFVSIIVLPSDQKKNSLFFLQKKKKKKKHCSSSEPAIIVLIRCIKFIKQ